MNDKKKKLGAVLLAGVLCVSLLSACASGQAATAPSDAGQDTAEESG